jgi:vancomycin resistance protein YoaR
MKKFNLGLGLVGGSILLLSVIGTGFEIRYWKRIYPGIQVGGADLGGMSFEEAVNQIAVRAETVKELVFKRGVNRWVIPIADIGLVYEPTTSALEAILSGRSGDIGSDLGLKLRAMNKGVRLDPIWNWDSTRLDQMIASMAAQIDVPPMEPEIVMEVNKSEIDVTSGENGYQTNTELLKSKIRTVVRNWGENEIEIPVTEIKPKLTDEQIEAVKSKARSVLGKKIVIEYAEGKQNWEVDDEQMLTWLDLQTGVWNRGKVKDWIRELAQTVNRPAQNSTFRFLGEGKVEEFEPAREGVTVLEENTTEMVMAVLENIAENTEIQVVDLEIRTTEPEIATGDANSLGIKELIGKGESWFTGSITNRIFNLKKAADTLNGILVAPDQVFSFNQAVGEVSANTGYKQAYIIKEGKTILGDGGGVCQVSSTLFRAILAAGLPIEERTAHAYRVSYYEVKYQPGFDATVFQPAPDLKFLNDTGNHILIQTRYDEKTKYLAFELYGTGDGRKVEISKARVWDVVSPPPDLYQDDPTLPVGKVVQTEHSAWGAKVAFDWKVARGEEILQQRTFYSNYRPWQAVYLRGTKTN